MTGKDWGPLRMIDRQSTLLSTEKLEAECQPTLINSSGTLGKPLDFSGS